MRVLAISDTHGMRSPVELAIERSKPDVLIFLGDGISALEELPDIYPEVDFHFIKGNCDYGSEPSQQLITLAGRRIFCTHGHLFYVKSGYETLLSAARSSGAEIVLFGHTHTAYTDYVDGIHILNPGSAACPANGKPSYGYVDIVGSSVVTNIVQL